MQLLSLYHHLVLGTATLETAGALAMGPIKARSGAGFASIGQKEQTKLLNLH